MESLIRNLFSPPNRAALRSSNRLIEIVDKDEVCQTFDSSTAKDAEHLQTIGYIEQMPKEALTSDQFARLERVYKHFKLPIIASDHTFSSPQHDQGPPSHDCEDALDQDHDSTPSRINPGHSNRDRQGTLAQETRSSSSGNGHDERDNHDVFVTPQRSLMTLKSTSRAMTRPGRPRTDSPSASVKSSRPWGSILSRRSFQQSSIFSVHHKFNAVNFLGPVMQRDHFPTKVDFPEICRRIARMDSRVQVRSRRLFHLLTLDKIVGRLFRGDDSKETTEEALYNFYGKEVYRKPEMKDTVKLADRITFLCEKFGVGCIFWLDRELPDSK